MGSLIMSMWKGGEDHESSLAYRALPRERGTASRPGDLLARCTAGLALDACTIDPLGPCHAILGGDEVYGRIGSYGAELLALGIPCPVRAHGGDLALSMGDASEPLIEALEPIHTANIHGDANLRSLGYCLTMGAHIDHSSIDFMGTIPCTLTGVPNRSVDYNIQPD